MTRDGGGEHMVDRPTILLVHGAWHGGWAWERVVPLLESEGLAVRVADLPSAGDDPGDLYDDVAEVRTVIDAVGGPVLTVGHSYGGQVISEAAAGAPDVVGLVYVAAFMLDEGQSLLDAVGGEAPPWWVVSDDGRTLTTEGPEALFYNDCDEVTAAAAVARLRPQRLASFEQPAERLPTSHSPFLSDPEAVARIVVSAL